MKLRLPKINNSRAVIAADPQQALYSSKRYYSKFFRVPYLKRLEMAIKLLGNKKYNRLLDIGFGSGFLLPELYRHCDRLTAIDVHRHIPKVKEMLSREGVGAEILSGDVLNLPFKNNSFDCIVCLSVLEFIDDIGSSAREIMRIAGKDATIIIGAPVLNKITEICYDKLVKARYHRSLHKSGHFKIISFINKYLDIEETLTYPSFMPLDHALFFVLKARKKRW